MSKMGGWEKIRNLPSDDPRKINHRLKSVERLRRNGGRKRTPEQVVIHGRKNALRRAYGITLADYDQMFEEQKGLCAICHRPETSLKSKGKTPKRLAVDHCHRSKRVRGLLCADCNLAIGFFEDDPLRIESALAYLAK